MDINKHINGCGLVWTNHTEGAPSTGTKALHDDLARPARSGLPHLARSSHGIGAETPVRRGRSRDKRGHAGAVGTNTRASGKAGVVQPSLGVALIANCESIPARGGLPCIRDFSGLSRRPCFAGIARLSPSPRPEPLCAASGALPAPEPAATPEPAAEARNPRA